MFQPKVYPLIIYFPVQTTSKISTISSVFQVSRTLGPAADLVATAAVCWTLRAWACATASWRCIQKHSSVHWWVDEIFWNLVNIFMVWEKMPQYLLVGDEIFMIYTMICYDLYMIYL